ncbi:MAG: hypothetical protein R2822_02600 [Spirosomataceae bacterium]
MGQIYRRVSDATFINVQDSSGKSSFTSGVFSAHPTIYLLDHEKKLLARWLSVEQLAAYFDNR